MNSNLYHKYKDKPTTDLLQITGHPELYPEDVVAVATEILKTREVAQEDADEAAEDIREDESAAPKQSPLANILNISGYTHQQWLNVILAIMVFNYLHLLYSDIKLFGYAFNGQTPYSLMPLLSFLDLLFLPFVYYMFYKRKRWGWILLFAARLFTIEPSLLFYFNEYWPTAHGIDLLTYSIFTIFLDIPILIFLWKQEVCSVFKVNGKIKWLTFLVVAAALVILTIIGQYNRPSYTDIQSNTESKVNPIDKQPDTSNSSGLKILDLIKKRDKKPLDTTYMATGFYVPVKKGKGVIMREGKTVYIDTISPLPLVSVKNVIKTSFQKIQPKEGEYTELCMTFDDAGTKALANVTGNPRYPQIAVVVANKLLYVVENKGSIKTGVMCVGIIGYSDKEIDEMRNAIAAKR